MSDKRNIFSGEIQTDAETETMMHLTLYILMAPVPVSAMMPNDLMEKSTVKVV